MLKKSIYWQQVFLSGLNSRWVLLQKGDIMKDFLTAWQFLTRVSINQKIKTDSDSMSRAYLYFPLVGLIIGILLALLGYGVLLIFKPLTAAIILAAGEILLTGGLHLDGFMDSCDGLFSGRGRERVLEIMKDSRVGSMGVIGILVLLGLRVSLLYELAGTNVFLPVIVAMPVFSRWTMVYVMSRYPYARHQGLGGLFTSGITRRHLALVTGYSALLLLWILPWPLPAAIILSLPICLWAAGVINRVLAGHTGDTYGFMNEISGVCFLLTAAIISNTGRII